ncbi:GIY-YIG nuclease family protein [Planktotalea sp.]|uniref:GIY-YIG nuclease family protein n=1 Tax=Planktotalea sp. TaxID=2029877 RepID=UPI0025F75180|nr:GIY-YIG nuclease family protein [Planktotalea sp.]
MSDAQGFRKVALADLSDDIGVYALCDLDGVPIYVGQSVDGIRSRVRRHLTSARSDIIANRQVDVWEIAYVWAWPVRDQADIEPLEAALFQRFDAQKPLMNGKVLPQPATDIAEPEKQIIQVIEEGERVRRLRPDQRLERQIRQYGILVDYILTVKSAPHLKRALDAHFERLVSYHKTFL